MFNNDITSLTCHKPYKLISLLYRIHYSFTKNHWNNVPPCLDIDTPGTAVANTLNDICQVRTYFSITKTDSQSTDISTARIEELIHDILNEQSPQEIDYVVKNMFRLDVDNSGTVTLEEFVLYVLKNRAISCSSSIVERWVCRRCMLRGCW